MSYLDQRTKVGVSGSICRNLINQGVDVLFVHHHSSQQPSPFRLKVAHLPVPIDVGLSLPPSSQRNTLALDTFR